MTTTQEIRVNPHVAAIPMSQREAIWRAVAGRTDVADLASGNPEMPMPEPVRRAIREHVDKGYARYTDYYGLPRLRQGIVGMLARDWGVHADPDTELIVTAGVQQGLYTVMRAVLNPGDEVIIPSPHYGTYYQNTVACGAVPVLVPLAEEDGFSPDMDRLAAALTGRSRALVFCNPNNPLGVVWPRRTLEALAVFARDNDLLVLVDEIYRDYTFGDPSSIAAFPGMARRTFTFGGFSKSHLMMGLRIGFVAGPAPLMAPVKRLHYCVAMCPSVLGQAAALAALSLGPEEMAPVYAHFRSKLERLYERVHRLPGVSCVAPQGGFYVFPNFSRYAADSMDLAVRLIREAGVAALPGTEFGSLGQGYLRLSVCATEQAVDQGIDRLEAFIRRQH